MKRSHARLHRIAGRSRKGWRCYYCGVELQCRSCFPDTARWATRDHVTPRAKGGTDALSNVVIACERCNHDKAAELLSEKRLNRQGITRTMEEKETRQWQAQWRHAQRRARHKVPS